MTRKEELRLALLRALAFVTFPPDLTKLSGKARILVVRPDHLGDVLFTTPALRLLRESLPEAHIACLVGPWAREVVANNPNVDEVLTCDFPWFSRRPKRNPLAPYLYLRREARKLKASRFDVATNLRFDFWWGAMLAYFAGIPHRVGYATPETKPYLTLALPYPRGRHEVLQNLRLAEVVAKLVGSTRPESLDSPLNVDLEFPVPGNDERFARDWVAANGAGESPIALIHPGAGSPVKLWTSENFAQVADALVEELGMKVLLTGTKAEAELVQSIKERMGHEPAVLIGASLGQLAGVLKRCRLAVGVDSGIMHLASAMGTTTVRLYGPVDDATFGPWGEAGKQVVIKANMDCIPCNRLDYRPKEIPTHFCIRSIKPDQVLAAVRKVLSPTPLG